MKEPRLQIAASQFEITAEPGAETIGKTGTRALEVAGPLKTCLLLLDDGTTRCCLITTHFGPSIPVNVSGLFRDAVARELALPPAHVLLFTSHNHSAVRFAANEVLVYESYSQDAPPAELLPVGEEFLARLREHARELPARLQPVTVAWAVGREDRITYNRKGRRADGSTYLMREEDRALLGPNFRGDVDTEAPVIVFRNPARNTVAALTQFTGHPITSFHPERPVVFGDWPQIACDDLAAHLDQGRAGAVPAGFLQGCAGDINSKEMLSGNLERTTEFGHLLGRSYIDALTELQPSHREGLDFATAPVKIPLSPLPAPEVLAAELDEIDVFLERAQSGDEDTFACVGLNFPKALSPVYRARLVDPLQRWNQWALELHRQGRAESVPTHLEMEIAVLRVGDIGIVGMPCEPFQEIGRQIRRRSPFPLTIPCGYMNVSHGYITDAENTGDREYMSAHYRYTRFRPPLARPAGNVLADEAVKLLNQFAVETIHES